MGLRAPKELLDGKLFSGWTELVSGIKLGDRVGPAPPTVVPWLKLLLLPNVEGLGVGEPAKAVKGRGELPKLPGAIP